MEPTVIKVDAYTFFHAHHVKSFDSTEGMKLIGLNEDTGTMACIYNEKSGVVIEDVDYSLFKSISSCDERERYIEEWMRANIKSFHYIKDTPKFFANVNSLGVEHREKELVFPDYFF